MFIYIREYGDSRDNGGMVIAVENGEGQAYLNWIDADGVVEDAGPYPLNLMLRRVTSVLAGLQPPASSDGVPRYDYVTEG